MSGRIWARLALSRRKTNGGSADPSYPPERFPNTLRTVFPDGHGQRTVFDPALLHFPNAYRAGDLRSGDPETDSCWVAARRTALSIVLDALAASPWSNDLVLRGSALMHAWYPAAAREPGDLDFVVRPESWEATDPRTDELFASLAHAAEQISANTPVTIHAQHAVSDEIWTYERVPGRRLMLPWTAGQQPGGWVQIDFVFGEYLPETPHHTIVALDSTRAGASVLTVSKQLSLVWKLTWLAGDMHPQGKDLYDAVLLAEDVLLDRRMLRDVLRHADKYYRFHAVGLVDFEQLEVQQGWEHFQGEYPHVAGSVEQWVGRLCAALEPAFTLLDGKPASGYELDADWLAPTIAKIGAATPDLGAELQEFLADNKIDLAASALITRELVGRDKMSMAEAVRLVVCTESRWAAGKMTYNHMAALESKTRAYGLELRAPWPKYLETAPIVQHVREHFPDYAAHIALEILTPIATDPDPQLSNEETLTTIVERSEGRVERLHYEIQRARTNPAAVRAAAPSHSDPESTRE